MRNKCFSIAIFYLVLSYKTRAVFMARQFLGILSHHRQKKKSHCVIYLEVKNGEKLTQNITLDFQHMVSHRCYSYLDNM